MKPITCYSDQAAEYVAGIAKAKTLGDLRAAIDNYKTIAGDAVAAAPKTDEEFAEWQRGRLKEMRGKFAGDKWFDRFGAVMLPEVMVQVSFIAEQFNVPWGCAFIRCEEHGMIKINDSGVAVWEGGKARLRGNWKGLT